MEEFWQQIKETISDFLTRELIPEQQFQFWTGNGE